jgi:hypothetical protein
MSNGLEVSTSPSNRLPSTGDALRRVSSTGKFAQPNSEKINIHSTPSSGIQRQSSTVSEYIRIKMKII